MFYPEFSAVQDNCILGIYHSNSWQSMKDRVLAQFKTNGVKLILIATTALCIVHFADRMSALHYGVYALNNGLTWGQSRSKMA